MTLALKGLTKTNHEKDQIIQRMQARQKLELEEDLKNPTTLLEQVLLPESKMLDSEVIIHGHKSNTVKICDKSMRAFDIS